MNEKHKLKFLASFLIFLILFLPVYSAHALTISNIRVRNITSNSADILWDTDSAASSMVQYGNYSYRNFSVSDAALVAEHRLTLSDLLADSKYYYIMTSATESDSATKGGDDYFFYTNVGDIIAPAISGILVSTTETTATISWATNEASTSKLYYGETAELGNEVSVSGMLAGHNVQLTDLTNNTRYFYAANSCDAYNNCANSSLLSFVAQSADTTPPVINATIPNLYGSSQIDIYGRTEAYTLVQLYINGALKRAATTSYNGTFLFPAVVLDPSYIPNTIRLHAKDAAGNENDANYNMTVDLAYPQLAIAPIHQISPIQTLKVNGSVDKNSTIRFYASLQSFDRTPPPAVENLSQSIVTANSAGITWNLINVADISKYAVYRKDVGRIATTITNYFIDVLASTNTTYAYQVSAVDAAGNEGVKSAMLYATTLPGGSAITQLPAAVELDVIAPQTILNNIHGNFSAGLSLQNGYNKIKIEAIDNIGHITAYENTTLFDPNPPVIVENNIGNLNPSYIPDVTIRGKVNKNATVYVYLNDETEPSYETATAQDGTFSVDVVLEKTTTTQEYQQPGIGGIAGEGLAADYPAGSINKIKLIAKDSINRESAPVEGQIRYTLCGFGSWWQINISDATPDMLTPRLMMLGLAQIGITAQVGWQGGYQEGSIMTEPMVNIMPLSPEQKKKYDLDWVQNIQATWSGDKRTGYVLIKLKALDPSIKNATSLEKENNLSDHRKDECPVPGFGCIKIPLMLEIKFYDPNLAGYSISPGIGGTQGTQIQTQTLTQKQCWDVIVNIDRRVPSDKIPKAFLSASVDLLNTTIELIDMILKPLNEVKTWTFYGCAGSWAYSFFNWFNEKWSCEYSGGNIMKTLLDFIGGTNQLRKVAEQGQCDAAFPSTSNDQKTVQNNQACKSCQDAIQRRMNWEQTMHWICDRIFCPSAPTLQNYVEEKKKITSDMGKMDDGDFTNLKAKTNNLVNANSDCELVESTGKQKILELYGFYKDSKYEYCKKLHPYDEKCCGYEYMREWDSACGVYPKFGFNELQESYCLVADPKDPNYATDCPTFKRIFNAAAGFCDPKGQPTAEYINGLRVYEKAENTEAIGEKIFYSILEKKDSNGKTISVDVERGYYRTNYVTAQATTAQAGQSRKVTQEVEFKLLKTLALFKDIAVIDKNNPNSPYYTSLTKFKQDYFSVAQPGNRQIPGVTGPGIETDAQSVFDNILSALGTTDKKYIVDPTSGLLRSIQCVCLPGITSYLSLYRSMMDAIRTCFNTILLTGDGNPGVCQAVLTQYVCDLIYDLINCFTKKFSAGSGARLGGGIGGFLGALTSAGTAVQKSVSGRYGGSTIWRTMFAERKLVHAICLFAFTGDWNLDVNSFLNENISVSIQSQPILYPCTRRFISYNPTTAPSGLATWNYHLGIGLVAGSPLNYRVYLRCSDDYSCNPAEGFEGGRCDCIGGEQTASINLVGGNGILTAGQILDSDTYQQVDAGSRYSQVRYDTTVLEWTWTDNTGAKRTDKQECRITQEGGKPPAFCEFDIGTGSYLCRLSVGKDTGEAYFDGEPYVRAEPFKTGEKLAATMNIKQQLPADWDKPERKYEYCSGSTGNFCAYTKQLRWTVTNQNGVIIAQMSSGNNAPNQPTKLLYENKQHQFTLPDIAVTKEMFERISTPTSTTKTCENVGVPTGTKFANSISVRPMTLPCDETFELIYRTGKTNDGDKFEYRIGAYSQTPTPTFTSQQTTLGKCTYDKSQSKVTCGNNAITITAEPTSDASTVFYSHTQTTQTTTSTFTCDNKEQPWNAVFMLYDYKKDDSTGQYVPSEQITMNNGAKQEKSVAFKAICDSSSQGTASAGPTIINSFTVDSKTGTILAKKNENKNVKITTTEDSTSAYMAISGPASGSLTLEQGQTKKEWVTKNLLWVPALVGKYTLQGHVTGGSLNTPYASQNTITAYVGNECTKDNDKGICISESGCPTGTKLDNALGCSGTEICCKE